MEQVSGWSEQGGSVVTVPGTQGSGAQRFQQSFRGATVTVRDSSNNLATIYSDDLASPTAKANPFTASSTTGAWNFYTTTGTYSLTFSGGSILAPFSITVNVGLGNAGGVPSYAFASLPTSKTQNAGDIARVTDLQRGLWMDAASGWFPVFPVANAFEFAGANFGAKVAAAIASLTSGGVVDARAFTGAQTISSNLNLGSSSNPITLILSPLAVITLQSSTINIFTGSRILGGGIGRQSGKTTTITRTGTATMIAATGSSASSRVSEFEISGLLLNGAGTAGHGIVFENVDSFKISDIQVRNGSGAVSAFRILNACYDFWVEDCLFMAWGDATTPIVNLQAGVEAITDGHWKACVIGDLDLSLPLGMPALVASSTVTQQRFVDCKFHTTGTGQVYVVDWAGYRSDFIGCGFQGTQAATTYVIQISNDDNRIIGGGINDLGNADGIRVATAGDLQVIGFTVRSENAPGTGSGVKFLNSTTSGGYCIVDGCTFTNLTIGIDASGTGAAVLILGMNLFNACTANVNQAGASFTWQDVNHGKSFGILGGLKLGTTPASAGIIRIPNNQSILSRNAANSADVGILAVNASDQLELFGNAWKFIAGGHLVASTTDTVDIGESGGSKPRNIYLTQFIGLGSRTVAQLGAPSDGTVTYCSDGQVTSGADNTVTSGGSGCLAVRINGVWRAFATQN